VSPIRFVSLLLAVQTGIVTGGWIAPPRAAAATQPGAAQPSIQDRLNRVRGDLFSGTGRVDDAIRELKRILAVDPGSAEGHLLLGIAYRATGSPELIGEAVAELRQAIALNPDFVPARFYLAHIYLDLGRAARAREEMESALAKVPGNPQFLAFLGEAERQLGNAKRSAELNRQALAADESFAQGRYYLGLALLDLDQRDEAIRELERVVQSGVKRPEVYLSLGAAYLDAGRVDAALEVLGHGASLDAKRPDLRIQLARAHRLKGMLDKAEEQLNLTSPLGPAAVSSPFVQQQQVEAGLYLEQGLLRLQQGRLDASAEAFQKLVEVDPGNGPAHRHLAEVYLLQGMYARSAEHAIAAEKLGSPLPADKRKQLDEKLRGKEAGSPR
jgi:tetratricopeptide (TPR) repeat protein